MPGTTFLKGNKQDTLLFVKNINRFDNMNDDPNISYIEIAVAADYYRYDTLKEFFKEDNIQRLDYYYSIRMAPETYDTRERHVKVDTFEGYTYSVDIHYNSDDRFYMIYLRKETEASLREKELRQANLDLEESLIELFG